MRRLAVCALVLAGLLGAGCGLTDFDVTESVPVQTVPGAAPGAQAAPSAFEMLMSLGPKDLPSGSSLIDSVTLSSVNLHVTAPPNGTFDFVQSVGLSISSPTNPKLPEKQIATGQPVSGSGQLRLAPTAGVDLLPYVHAGAVVHGVATGSPPATTTTFAGDVILTVHLF